MCLISLAFVFFKAFIFAALHTQREILFSLNSLFFHFHTVFYVFYQCRRQWIKAIIDFTPSDDDSVETHQSWPIQ